VVLEIEVFEVPRASRARTRYGNAFQGATLDKLQYSAENATRFRQNARVGRVHRIGRQGPPMNLNKLIDQCSPT
jgi:hypothetical protein